MAEQITDKELGRGIDAFHPETKLQEGYSPEIVNWNPSYNGSLIRRKGYQRVGGYLPLRIYKASQTGNTLTLTLSPDIDLLVDGEGVKPCPIVLYGRLVRPTATTPSGSFPDLSIIPSTTWYSTCTIVNENTISVTASSSVIGTVETYGPDDLPINSFIKPDLDAWVWGLPLTEVPQDSETDRTTWVTSLSSYTSLTQNTLIATAMGQVYTLADTEQYNILYNMPTTQISAELVTDGDQVIGPSLFNTIPNTAPSKGYLVAPNVYPDNYVNVKAVTYDTNTAHTTYILDVPDYILSKTPIASGDYLHVEQSPYTALDGDHKVISVSYGSDIVTIVCDNIENAKEGAGYSDPIGGKARAGIFTDTLTVLTSTRPLHTGDTVEIPSVSDIPLSLEVLSSVSTTLKLNKVTDILNIIDGALVSASRTSRILTPNTLTGFVRGDMIQLDAIERQLQAVTVWPFPTQTVTVTPAGTEAVVSGLTLGKLQQLRVGDYLQLAGGTLYDGTVKVSDVDTTGLTFSFLSTGSVSATCTLVGNTLAIDEELPYTATSALVVPSRWAPIQPPDLPQKRTTDRLVSTDLVPAGMDTIDGTTIPLPASAFLKGNRYIANGEDPTLAVLPTSAREAGLWFHAPILGYDVITNVTTKILNTDKALVGNLTGTKNVFTLTDLTEINLINVGDYITLASTNTGGNRQHTFHTKVVGVNTTTGKISFSPSFPEIFEAFTLLYKTKFIRYTARWVATDSQDNTLATIAAQSKDIVVALGPDAAVSLRLALYPPTLLTNYENITLQILRTAGGSTPALEQSTFYQVGAIPLRYKSADKTAGSTVAQSLISGYITYVDSAQLGQGTKETLASTLTDGAGIGAAWEGSPKAKTAATIANRLLLGNIKGYPEHTISLREVQDTMASQFTSATLTSPASNVIINQLKSVGTRVIFRRKEAEEGAVITKRNTQAYEFIETKPQSLSEAASSTVAHNFQYLTIVTSENTTVEAENATGTRVTFLPQNRAAFDSPSTLPTIGTWSYLYHPLNAGEVPGNPSDLAGGWYRFVTPVSETSYVATGNGTDTITLTYSDHSELIGLLGHRDGGLLATYPSYVIWQNGTSPSAAYQVGKVDFDNVTYNPTNVTLKVIKASGSTLASGAITIKTFSGYITTPTYRTYKTEGITSGNTLQVTNHGLYTGAPILITYSSVAPTVSSISVPTPGMQLYASVVDANNLMLHYTLYDALNGTGNLVFTNTPTLTLKVIQAHSSPHANGVQEFNPMIMQTSGFEANAVPVPVPCTTAGVSNYFKGEGMYDTSFEIPQTSVLMNYIMRNLSRAINAVNSEAQEQEFSAVGTGNYTSQAVSLSWLSSDTGADYSLATIYVRSKEDFTVQIVNGLTENGKLKANWFAGTGEKVKQIAIPLALSNIDPVTNSIYYVNHGFVTGDKVYLDYTIGANVIVTSPVGQLNASSTTPRYVIATGANTFSLATTYDNALAGMAIDITSEPGQFAPPKFLLISQEVGSVVKSFPSRLVRSYPNYPEIYDAPYDDSDITSDSIIDVNPEDGQEIQAIIPFYADSFTTAALQEARLVVFKDRNVYMVNTETREVQQIQTMGHGAYFPRTVTDTKDGISYADRDGLYKINRQGQWIYRGQVLGRLWNSLNVKGIQRDLPVAIHDSRSNLVITSLPSQDAVAPDVTIVYDHTREYGDDPGAWTQWDNYKVVCWAEHLGLTYFGGRQGLIYVERDTGADQDYRDDADPITSTVTLRPMDFGVMGYRKAVDRVTIQFRRSGDLSIDNIRLYAGIDMQEWYLPCDSFKLEYKPMTSGTGDVVSPRIYSVSFSLPLKKMEYLQLRIVADGLDQPVEITQVMYSVSLMTTAGTTQAGDTTAKGGK